MLDDGALKFSDRYKLDAEVSLEACLKFFKDCLGGSFRPLTDICVSRLHSYKIDLLQRKQEMEEAEGEEEEAEPDAPEPPAEPPVEAEQPAEPAPPADDQIHDATPKGEEPAEAEAEAEESEQEDVSAQAKMDFFKHAICLQLHMEGKEVAKGFFENFDPMKKGQCNLQDFLKVMLGPF